MLQESADLFTDIQADMIDICLEYVDDKAQVVYIYCSCEENTIAGDVFYAINDKVLKKHKLNDADNGVVYDVSINMQKQVIQIINDDINKLKELCANYNRPMPTQIKLTYDVVSKKVNADYKYDIIYSNSKDKASEDIFNEWYSEEQSK